MSKNRKPKCFRIYAFDNVKTRLVVALEPINQVFSNRLVAKTDPLARQSIPGNLRHGRRLYSFQLVERGYITAWNRKETG